jgi:hypothetical protein
MFNWGYVIASLLDKDKNPEQISTRMLISINLYKNSPYDIFFPFHAFRLAD